jgi:hypothetical protein
MGHPDARAFQVYLTSKNTGCRRMMPGQRTGENRQTIISNATARELLH